MFRGVRNKSEQEENIRTYAEPTRWRMNQVVLFKIQTLAMRMDGLTNSFFM
jgi:hypothetical protein